MIVMIHSGVHDKEATNRLKEINSGKEVNEETVVTKPKEMTNEEYRDSRKYVFAVTSVTARGELVTGWVKKKEARDRKLYILSDPSVSAQESRNQIEQDALNNIRNVSRDNNVYNVEYQRQEATRSFNTFMQNRGADPNITIPATPPPQIQQFK
ncbi:MAG: hypothetical protein A2293_00365 [Elusimicrobia bacterium RIFOXYB2_FULL_49_7]|nr:MAG: hypothetical protein A2293_00365 [Elusimicrobia bacterium RIFOXYB2_FULL_49_7]